MAYQYYQVMLHFGGCRRQSDLVDARSPMIRALVVHQQNRDTIKARDLSSNVPPIS